MQKIRFALATTALMAVMGTSALAADEGAKIVWGGGDKGKSAYTDTYVPHIIDVLAQNRLAGYQWGGVSEGTVMNAEKVTDNPTNLAVGQLDILTQINGQPISGRSDGATYRFTVLATDLGPECLYAITAQRGYSTWGDVLGNAWDLTVITGGEKSGSFATWNRLAALFPDLADMNVVNAGGNDKIVAQTKSTPDSVGFFVMRPDPNSEIFQQISDAGLTLVPVIDFTLEDAGYNFKELKVANTGVLGLGKGKFHSTACTSVALITGDPKNPAIGADGRTARRLQETIKRIGAVSTDDLKPNTDDWRTMFAAIKDIGADRLKELASASKSAFDATVKAASDKVKEVQQNTTTN